MNKKYLIIAIAIVLATICFVLAGCNTKTDGDETTTDTTTATSPIEVFTEAEGGEPYVTNKKGEHIPVTTSLDGSIEFVEDLVTKTAEQVSNEAESINRAKENTTGAKAPSTTAANQNPGTTASQGVEVNTDSSMDDLFDEDNAAVIDWD